MNIKNKNKIIKKVEKITTMIRKVEIITTMIRKVEIITTMILVSSIHKIWVNKLNTGKIKSKMKIKLYLKN